MTCRAIFALGLVVAATALAQTGNRGATAVPREATQFLKEKKLALIIGINDYQEETGLSKLKYAVNDANDLAKALQVYGYQTDVLTDGRAIRVTIRRHLDDMLKRVDPDSGTVLFAFSGHGGKAGAADYLASYDAAADSLDRDGISVDWIKGQLSASNAARKMMFLDACRTVTSPGGKDASAPVAPFARLSDSKGLRMLISTAEGTRSYETDELKHGLFTYYLLSGLRGSAAGQDGLITFNRLADYVTGKVKETRPGQVPYTDGQYSGDFFLGGEFKAAPTPAAGNTVNMDLERYNAVKESRDPAALEREAAKIKDVQLAELLRVRAETMRSLSDVGQQANVKAKNQSIADLRKRADESNDKKEYAAAYPIYQQLAALGDPWGLFRVGFYVQYGLGVAKSPQAAIDWYRKAAEAGEPTAMANMGYLYAHGEGVEKDDKQAIAWYLKAAAAKNARAMNNLGFMYQEGRGVPKDEVEGANWYLKAAMAGDVLAMCNLGSRYETGVGVTKDPARAAVWYRNAANAKDPAGMYNLGRLNEDGIGMPKDRDKAITWYRTAANAGDQDAKTALKRLGQ